MSQIPNLDNYHHHHHLVSHEPSESFNPFQAWRLPDIFKRCWMSTDHYTSEQRPLLISTSASYSSIPSSPPVSLTEKYGTCTEILHYGSFSSVRLYTRKSSTNRDSPRQLHVVKIFRPSSRPSITRHHHFEISLSSALDHPNILRTVDALHNDHGALCLVTDYCAAGDLHTLIATTPALKTHEADCFFKQILRAVTFLHDHAIAHRDLTPENILLTIHGAIKLADFGSAAVDPDGEKQMDSYSYSPPPRKLLGTVSYIAPEELGGCLVDARAGDVWAAGLVYMAMRCRRLLWRMAEEDDGRYREYLVGRKGEEGFAPIEGLGEKRCRNTVYAMLDPNPRRRITASQVLRSEWMHEVRICYAGQMGW